MIRPLFSTLLVGVSGSDASIAAAKQAIIMAKQYKCRLVACFVVDIATIKHLQMTKIFVQEESAEFEAGLRANGERYLRFMRELAASKQVPLETELRFGAVYTELLAVAEERGADLIVLGGWEKDRTPFDIISRAHREILFHSKCSIMIVKEPLIDQMFAAL